ncbi:hypothetical protein C5C74_12215 [Rathayibacter sp. AY1E8]|uniref:hypothetical protein n=1 Tax=unclassified Rathayibacter TaxID=2609250 RepID=UPI000CE8F352|nr:MULTISPECIES: hypothetical protein [unclassified Rathayibacter]PPF67728.1 hypothetical protein C5C46_15280 [Rathayibacter sp. AY1E6]PPG16384.1 hypothetical protein C5C74_12215 [Rathayibacter sp. AY1E8]PPH84419.1 hypothetical protein C5C82_14390 [Rathayibacter sp. AY1D5]
MGAGRTKTAAQIDARKRARDRAAVYREREEKLENLATDYFAATDREDAILTELEEEIRKLPAASEEQATAARLDEARAIAGMGAYVSPAETAERLGITSANVRAAIRALTEATATAPSPTEDANDDASDAHEREHDSAGEMEVTA